jgi:hypothetical protein
MSYSTRQPIQRRQNPLARQIAETFHDLDRLRSYDVCCQKYPPPLIQQAFKDALNIPEAQIKKSRAAIFFYLVKRYAHQTSKNYGQTSN